MSELRKIGSETHRVQSWRTAVDAFQWHSRTDDGDALCDLLCDLMHLAEAERRSFDAELSRARRHFEYEREHDV